MNTTYLIPKHVLVLSMLLILLPFKINIETDNINNTTNFQLQINSLYSDQNEKEDNDKDEEVNENGNQSTEKPERNEGDEVTGEITAICLIISLMPVIFGLLSRLIIKLSNNQELKSKINQLNYSQKKYLKYFHYYLTPFALVLDILHFSRSSCNSNILPDMALFIMALFVVSGLLFKFKLLPENMRIKIINIHTSYIGILLFLFVLILGHRLL